jgi:hypothetical protein
MGRVLSTVDALREILRVRHPDRKDLLQIASVKQLHYAKSLGIEDPSPAHEALDLLRTGVSAKTIRLRGCLYNASPNDIDPIDVVQGELSVFEGTLKIYEHKSTFRTSRIYTSVHCYAEDIQHWLGQPAVNAEEPPRRAASKEEIRMELRAVYAASTKPPNVKEAPKAVQPRLHERGLEAAERYIAEIADEAEFQKLRRKPGKTIASERAK